MLNEGFDSANSVEKSISAAMHSKRFPHAVIIEGGSSEERLSLAKKTAAALVCSGGGIRPCLACADCRKAVADSHADILVYSVEDKPKAFKVDIVREIRNKAYIVPNEADRKVFILENSHTMGNEGQNAILKILEEPPSYINFILLCSSKSGFLPTVLSRATVYSLGETSAEGSKDIPWDEIKSAAEGIALASAALDDIEIIKAAAVFEKNPKLLKASIPVIQEIYAQAMRKKYSACEAESEFSQTVSAIEPRLSRKSLLALIETTDMILNSIRLNANHNLTVTALCTNLRKAVTN